MNATATDNPSSLKMGEWNKMQGVWKQNSDITLEISDGKAEDFMFTFNDISFSKLGDLVAKSIVKLQKEKDIKNPVIKMVSIQIPTNVNFNSLKIKI